MLSEKSSFSNRPDVDNYQAAIIMLRHSLAGTGTSVPQDKDPDELRKFTAFLLAVVKSQGVLIEKGHRQILDYDRGKGAVLSGGCR